MAAAAGLRPAGLRRGALLRVVAAGPGLVNKARAYARARLTAGEFARAERRPEPVDTSPRGGV
nr:hypothetical protein GCM10020063_018080 [Dactylosporangium thailandense]